MKIIIKSIPNKYSVGGSLNSTQGMDINKNLVSFNAGQSHELNPNGGILQGTGSNGQPNLVEEGETKHEDYIFSDRLKVNPMISKQFKLPKWLNGKTFADASKYLNREAKDRPNDPISKNAVKAHLAKLTAAQEGLKEQMQAQQPQQHGIPMEGQPNANMLAQGQQFAYGGDQTHYQNLTLQGSNIGAEGMDLTRYTPVAANVITGIGDMFEKPEVVKFGRVNPERITARMDYQPVDTEWMNNKMNATYAGTRDQMINQSGGNRAIAMAGLSGINQQQQNAVGEAYLKGQDMNYQRRNQATQFNAGIEAQNVAAQNAAQQTNLQLQMQEMDANARNRAAKRNAARQAILNAATNIGQIGKENFDAKTGQQIFGYGQDPNGIITYDGNKYKKV